MNGGGVEGNGGSPEYWKIIHVPEKPPVLSRLRPTVDVVAAEIEARHANTIVRKLNHVAPLEGLRHVKRVRKVCLDGGKSQLSVILCLASGSCDELSCMPEEVKELVKTYQLSSFNVKVSKFAASTKEEWEEQCKLWPTSFHPPTYCIEGITGFNDEESKSVFNFMKLAVNMVKSRSRAANAAIIVDPSTSQIIASACDQVFQLENEDDLMKSSDHHKLLEKCTSGEARENYKGVACLQPWGWIEQHRLSSTDSWHPLRHAVIEAIEKSAARDRQLYPLNFDDSESPRQHSSVLSPVKRLKMDTDVSSKVDERLGNDRPYLCTGYDIFFVWEPCIMCAMAIVHQRIKRVFYAFQNRNNGALGSVYRLQGERSLNHHYAVFQVVLPEDILHSCF